MPRVAATRPSAPAHHWHRVRPDTAGKTPICGFTVECQLAPVGRLHAARRSGDRADRCRCADPVTEGTDNRLDIGLLYDNEQFSADWGVNAELRYRYIDYTSGDGFREWPPGHTDASGIYPAGVFNQMTSAEQRLSGEAGGIYHGIDDHAIRMGPAMYGRTSIMSNSGSTAALGQRQCPSGRRTAGGHL